MVTFVVLVCNSNIFSLEFALTEMGEKVKRLPLSPMLARFVYLGWKLKCSHEVLTIAAFCSIDDFLIPPESMDARKKEEHDRFMRTFNTPDGDHFRLVHIYRAYKKQGSKNMRAVGFKNFMLIIYAAFLFRVGVNRTDSFSNDLKRCLKFGSNCEMLVMIWKFLPMASPTVRVIKVD